MYWTSGSLRPFSKRIKQIIPIFVLTKWNALLECIYTSVGRYWQFVDFNLLLRVVEQII